MSDRTILFTAFEPSGDHHASLLIRGVKEREPGTKVFAFGGPMMQEAGAELIETTTEKAVMMTDVWSEILAHRARLKRVASWLQANKINAHVPVDSPAANWGTCKAVRKHQPKARIVHLVAPQLWAWAPWRIRRMLRLSDHVMCLLPFEPDWFGARGMPGTFVGHPMFNREVAFDPSGFPETDKPKLALLPGSRAGELMRNTPMMLESLKLIQAAVPGVEALFALRTEDDRKKLLDNVPGVDAVNIVCARTDDAVRWADAVLVCSGTATLQVCAHNTPQAAVYIGSRLMWYTLGRLLIRTRTFTLPNIVHEWIDGTRAIDEHIFNFGDPKPPADSIIELLKGEEALAKQAEAYQDIHRAFAAVCFADKAPEVLFEQIG